VAELVDAVDSKSTGLAHLGSTPSEATSRRPGSVRTPSEACAEGIALATGLARGDFDYQLPAALIAQTPLADRSASRLLVLEGHSQRLADRQIAELPALLAPGDLLVFNDTRVIPARLKATKPTGGRIELLLERILPGARALVQLRDSKAVRPGMRLASPGGAVTVLARAGELWEVQLPAEPLAFFEQHGIVPLPPYIRREATPADRERYQSVFARAPGAVAAPTASLHFDAPLLDALAARGIQSGLITLHVGAGTFAPLRSEQLDAHRLHSEWYEVGAATVAQIARTRRAGGRVVAVGTTVARALESAALASAGEGAAALSACTGETTLFIRPGFRLAVIDALLTNFHLPQSTLLMLVAAVAGREAVLAAYAHAVQARYRFFSYGDAMLVFP
jgi:S-adenosylmethionine:tRNA ribosyltransferase-isomerase